MIAAEALLQYMESHSWIDKATSRIEVTVPVYNLQLDVFVQARNAISHRGRTAPFPVGSGSAASHELASALQVNTSGEESKSGCLPDESAALCAFVADACPALRVRGLMGIGQYTAAEGGADDDFAALAACRQGAAAALGVAADALALSMGMSHDFETALRAGATHVRVGSTIFGARAPKP